MQKITAADVDKAIAEIKEKIPGYSVDPKLLHKFSDSPEDQEAKSYIGGPNENYTKFLPLLIEKFQLKNIVELGNREGRSTLCMYEKLPADASFITIDIEKDQRYCPDVMYSDPRVQFIFGDVCDLSIFNGKVPTDIDLLFTDTIHYDFQLRDEFAVYEHLLADVAFVAIDDINVNDKRGLFDEVKYDKWDLTDLCHPTGWGLFLFVRKNPMSAEERYVKALEASAKIWKRKADELGAYKQAHEDGKISSRIKKFVRGNPALHKALISVKNKLR